jgi:hypothetical protein
MPEPHFRDQEGYADVSYTYAGGDLGGRLLSYENPYGGTIQHNYTGSSLSNVISRLDAITMSGTTRHDGRRGVGTTPISLPADKAAPNTPVRRAYY